MEFGAVENSLYPLRQSDEKLTNLFRLLSQVRRKKKGKTAYGRIKIKPSSPCMSATFSSGKTVRIPELELATLRMDPRGPIANFDSLLISVTQPPNESSSRYTNGMCCLVHPDGSVLPTVGFWEGQYGCISEFLREWNDDIVTNSATISKICKRCIFCNRCLKSVKSMKNGCGRACQIRWKLDQFILSTSNPLPHSGNLTDATTGTIQSDTTTRTTRKRSIVGTCQNEIRKSKRLRDHTE
jgi:hypothetical protein